MARSMSSNSKIMNFRRKSLIISWKSKIFKKNLDLQLKNLGFSTSKWKTWFSPRKWIKGHWAKHMPDVTWRQHDTSLNIQRKGITGSILKAIRNLGKSGVFDDLWAWIWMCWNVRCVKGAWVCIWCRVCGQGVPIRQTKIIVCRFVTKFSRKNTFCLTISM